MPTAYIRYKQYIRSREVVLTLLLSLLSFSVNGQVTKKLNLVHYDDVQIHYGFQLGLNRTGFRVQQSQQFIDTDTVQALYGTASPGFSLGFLFNYRLADFFDIRFTPYVGFYERRINFEMNLSDEPVLAQFQSSIIELPVVLKYKSSRRGNNRMYMFGGLKTSIEVGGKKKQRTSTQLTTKSLDLSLDYGIGVDIYYELFKLSPEIRFSYGLRNLFVSDDNLYSQNLDGLSTFTTTFFLYFE